MGGGMGGSMVPFTEPVDWANPAAFYLGVPGMEGMADVTIKHSGLDLPAHSLILAMAGHSAVLRDLFRSLRSVLPGQQKKRCEEARGLG